MIIDQLQRQGRKSINTGVGQSSTTGSDNVCQKGFNVQKKTHLSKYIILFRIILLVCMSFLYLTINQYKHSNYSHRRL